MRSYEEISNRIMERGDKLIESRKVRAAKIRHTSYAVSGMCAAAIAGIGLWHIASNIKKPDEGFHGSGIVTATEASSGSTTAPAVTTTAVNTTAEKTTSAKTTTITSDKKITDTTTTAAATAATTAAGNVVHATITTATTSAPPVKETTTVTYSPTSLATTATADPPTPVNTTAHSGPTSTAETIRTTIAPRGEEFPVTTKHAESIEETVITPSITTTIPTGIKETTTTDPVTTTTNIQYAFRTHPTYATLGSIRYDKQEVIPNENVGGYISRITVNIKVSYGLTITDTMRAYSITGIDNEEAIAVRLKDTDEYYLFRNQRASEKNSVKNQLTVIK